MKTVLLTIFILALATYVYMRYRSCGCGKEGFKATPDTTEKPNPLVKLIKKLGTMTKYLSDPHMWKDRIEMFGMSPADLARRHLNSMKQQK
jgi:hypothetical protein